MRYCIVMPKLTQSNDQSYQFPIGMAYVSSSLKHTGRDVITYNLNYKNGSVKELITKLVLDNHIDVFATGGLTPHYWQIREMLDSVRTAKPDTIICVGGG